MTKALMFEKHPKSYVVSLLLQKFLDTSINNGNSDFSPFSFAVYL